MHFRNFLPRRSSLPAVLVGAALMLGSLHAGAQTLRMFLSPPGEQNTTQAGATVEPFSDVAGPIGGTGSFTVGTFVTGGGTVNRFAADQFGGAGGTGNYLALSSGRTVTVTLTGNRKYVGFWWSAGNNGNTIEFRDDTNTLLAQFTTNSLTTLLGGGGNITAINGTPYAKASYFGNPNAPFLGQNGAQPYGYINLMLEGASVNFRTIVIRHQGSGNFELDNLALVDSPTVPSTWVDIGTLPVALPAGAIGATDDAATTPFNTPVGGNVATNDTTVAGSTFGVTANPTNGSVVLDPATGAYTYTPNPGFSGLDNFTYRQCKPAPEQTTCVTAVVRVVVGPNAADDNAGPATQGVPFNASVTGNDSAPAGSTYATLTTTANGTLNLNSATGAYTYTANPGFTGTDTFTYRVCLPAPNAALCDDATVNISVIGQVPPVASSVAVVGVPVVGQPITANYTYTDANSDVQGTSTFRWVRSTSNSVAGGTTVATTSGYTPVAGDAGNLLFFCVTPVAATGATPGLEVCSPGSLINATSPIPTLSQWGQIILSVLMALSTLAVARRRH